MRMRNRLRLYSIAPALVLGGLVLPSFAMAESVPITKFFVAPEVTARPWSNATISNGGLQGLEDGGYIATPMPDESDPPAPNLAAGAHPNVNIFIRYCNPDDGVAEKFGCGPDIFTTPKKFKLSLPPGLVGNPNNVPVCPWGMFILSLCPANTAIGETSNSARLGGGGRNGEGVSTKLYNVETLGLAPALIGTNVLSADPPGPLPIRISLRPDDYGIDSVVDPGIPILGGGINPQIFEQRITLFGTIAGKPFMTNPTACQSATSKLRVTSWDQAVDSPDIDESLLDPGEASASFTPNSCGSVPFDPTVSIDSDSAQPGAPASYDVKIHIPDSELAAVHQSHVRTATVTLPQGVSLSAPAGKTLQGCSAGQFGLGNSEPVSCPAGSVIGDVTVASPLVSAPLTGHAYFAQPSQSGQPTTAHPWQQYLLIEGSGVRVKLAGDVVLSDDGRISTTFDDLPQLPFTDFELELNGGDGAVLANPRDCAAHAADVSLTGWSGAVVSSPDPDVSPTVQSSGCASPEPFQPAVDAHADNEDAGAHSPSHIDLDRADGQSLMRKLSLELPPGLIGSLTTAPLCSVADAQSGNCGDASKVGNLKVTVGHGTSQLQVAGSAFIAEPTAPGDVATFAIDIPAKVGPIDLGKVTVLNHVKLRQSDGGLTATSDPIPTILGGIPLPVKHIQINIDRQDFLRNPTGCDPRQLNASFDSDRATSSTASVTLSAKNCDQLPFSPRLRLIVPGGSGNTHKGRVGIANHTPLRAIVTQDPGQASIKRAEVVLPSPLRPDTGVLNKPGVLCTTAGATIGVCPSQSNVGSASVITPLLPQPLTGPVYIVQDPGSVLPKLLVQLRGLGAIDLVAGNSIVGVRTVNTFDGLPDLPQSRFELSINGGPGGILFNFNELCDTPSTADATFTGHSGKTTVSHPQLEVEGCSSTITKFRIPKQTVRVSKKRTASVKVECPKGGSSCSGNIALRANLPKKARRSATKSIGKSGRFAIASGKSRKVKVKLTKAAFKQLKKKRTLAAKVTGKAGSASVTGDIKLKAPKRPRR